MRKQITFTLSMMLTLLAANAQAQSANWRSVENLLAGTAISVKSRHRLVCYFESATDDGLFCQLLSHNRPSVRQFPVSFPRAPFPAPLPARPSEIFINRTEVREVRLEHSEGTNAVLGAVTVGGIGAAIGSAKGPAGALLFGVMGAIGGGVFSRDFPISHRKVIYKYKH